MAPWSRTPRTTPATGHRGLTTSLRFELVDEEQRALLGSYGIASALGIAFLLLVQFGPHVPPVAVNLGNFVIAPPEPNGPAFRDPTEIPARRDVAGRSRAGGRLGTASVTSSINRAFGGASAVVGQPTNILGGVVVTRPGTTTAAETGGKTVLEHGEGGVSSIAPGRGGIGSGSGTGADIGGVRPGGGVTRSAITVEALPVIAVDPLTPRGDVAAVGTFVRGHESQLRFCYEEHGLRVNPALGGLVTVAVSVAENGAVSRATVTKRSWSGAGASEAEACIVRAIGGWRLPSSAAGAGTYSFPFNFSR